MIPQGEKQGRKPRWIWFAVKPHYAKLPYFPTQKWRIVFYPNRKDYAEWRKADILEFALELYDLK